MNKTHIVYGVTLAVILIAIFVIKEIPLNDVSPELDERMLTDTEDLLPSGKEGSPTTLRGSCNLITTGSTCIEYFGYYWTEETINMACTEGSYSTEGCPAPNMGGCRILPGSESDMITWHYDSGGTPYTQENITYASKACSGVPGGVWVEED